MDEASAIAMSKINLPYLLIIHIPVYVDDNGTRWVDDLWHKDLVRHLDYLDRFTLCCPHIHKNPPTNCRSLDGWKLDFVPLPRQGGFIRNLATAPFVAFALWRAIQRTSVVHSGVGNWNPLSLGNLVFLISAIQRKFLLVIVESSSWRLLPRDRGGLLARLRSRLSEFVNAACVTHADLSIFTHSEYKRSLLKRNSERGHVIHASWIDENNILDADSASAEWARKRSSADSVKFLFAGRLEADKGLLVLLQALRELADKRQSLNVDFMGRGALEKVCTQFVAEMAGSSVTVRMREPVAYGEPFFSVMREYAAVLVPSLGDEQPRIVYDAFSQAVSVIASATHGLMDCVEDKLTGVLCAPDNVAELADALAWSADNIDKLESMGMGGLERARSLTHAEMHRRRLSILTKNLGQRFASDRTTAL